MREDVEHHAEGAAQPVMRAAAGARTVADGHLGDARAIERRQRRDEAVQLAVEIDVLENFGAVGLEGGAEIAQLHVRRLGHQPIGDARGKLARDRVIQAVLAPAAGDVVAFLDLFEQRGNVLGSVLEIAVERNDDVALRFVEPGGQRRGLAEVAPQPDHLEARIGLDQIGQQIEAAVGGGVVDKNDFVGLAQALEHGRQPVVERQDGRFLIMDRDDDGEACHGAFRIASARLPSRGGNLC